MLNISEQTNENSVLNISEQANENSMLNINKQAMCLTSVSKLMRTVC